MQKLNYFLAVTCYFLLFVILYDTHVFSQQNKTTVAVLEFQTGGSIEKTELLALTNRFRALLVKAESFQVLEREKMNDILREQDFILSDNCNTNECAVQVGQLLGVEVMIAGDIGKVGNTFTVDMRMIEVQTGVVIQSESRNYEGQSEGLLSVIQTMADDFSKISGKTAIKDLFRGPSYALYSVAIPGWGGYYMDRDKTRSILTTVSALGLMGYGLYQNSKANDYFSDYKKSRDRDEMNSLYKKANSARHKYYIATRVGAAIWIADIVWVAYKGFQNKKRFQSGQITSPNNGLMINYCENQVQLGYSVTF